MSGALPHLLAPLLVAAVAARQPATHATWTLVAVPAARRTAGTTAIRVDGDGVFPARAADPVLHVGTTVLRHYRYAGTGSRALVFDVPAGAVLEDGAPIALRWEPGPGAGIDLGVFRAAGAR